VDQRVLIARQAEADGIQAFGSPFLGEQDDDVAAAGLEYGVVDVATVKEGHLLGRAFLSDGGDQGRGWVDLVHAHPHDGGALLPQAAKRRDRRGSATAKHSVVGMFANDQYPLEFLRDRQPARPPLS
jgi:hypothetical protein